jgi:quercetin dioxygenase-like cupin family protein
MKRTTTRVAVAGFMALAAAGVAWATTGVGISTTIVSGPTRLEAIHLHSKSDINNIEIKTKGSSDVYVVYNTIAPGGNTGWHSHPGPSIVSVKSGTATEYHSDDPTTPHVYTAGMCFVDAPADGDHSHIVRNEGTTNLELVAFQVLPAGATRRIDKPAP